MRPKTSENEEGQLELGRVLLETFLNMKNELILLGKAIDWEHFCERFGESFHKSQGRPGLPTRLMVGLTYLKYLHNLSDEKVIKQWLQNPYWQYFCGFSYFQKQEPCEASSLTRFRERLGEEGAEDLLKQTVEVARRFGLLKKSALRRVIADTTVQEKNITYPTDAKLINKAREKLVKEAKGEDIKLRQSYRFKGKSESVKLSLYFHARQYKRGKASLKRQKTWLGRVIRDIKRKCCNEPSEGLRRALELGERVFNQERNSKDKIYSLHEVHVECISKGKVRQAYEFGNKVSFVVTAVGSWIIGARSFFGNPFDGRTLISSVCQVEDVTGEEVRDICVDKGYRGKVYHPEGKRVYVSGGKRKGLSLSVRRFLKRRASIEPVIGHMKQEFRMGVNYLGGIEGDKINPILSASAFNLQKLLRSFALVFFSFLKKWTTIPFFLCFSTKQ